MNGIDDLEDLLRLTSDELMKIIPDLNIGTAKRVLAFAQDDDLALWEHKQPHLVKYSLSTHCAFLFVI